MIFRRAAAAALALTLVTGCTESAVGEAGWRERSWQRYVEAFVQTDGRVIDPTVVPGLTTSEGQAYTMIRAVWMDDRATFDRVHAWTKGNLVRKGSPLPAWKWGKRENGSWGILDANTASDADVHIAFALFAGAIRWSRPELEVEGRAVAEAIWKEEIREVAGRQILLPGNWAVDGNPVVVNLSYYVPGLFRRLAVVDPSRPWLDLVDTTYHLLQTKLPTTDLPPDWLIVRKATGEVAVSGGSKDLPGRFGPDAWRVYFNVAMDYVWDRSPEAEAWLKGQRWLPRFLAKNKTLPWDVDADAVPKVGGEPLGLYAALYPSLALFERDPGQELRKKIDAAWRDGVWAPENDYYAQNLVWFGLALADGLLPPLIQIPKARP